MFVPLGGSYEVFEPYGFRSAWTQKVRLTSLQGQLADGASWGLMQFVGRTHSSGNVYNDRYRSTGDRYALSTQ